MYSIWTKSGLSRCRDSVKMRYNLLSHYRNVTKEAVVDSVSATFLFSLPPSLPPFLSAFLVETFSQKYDLYRLDKGPLEKSTLNIKDATYALKTMNCIRRMENRAAELYRQRLINGFLHLYTGQVDENNLNSESICMRNRRAICCIICLHMYRGRNE